MYVKERQAYVIILCYNKNSETRGKCGSRIKAGKLYVSPYFSTQINVSLSTM